MPAGSTAIQSGTDPALTLSQLPPNYTSKGRALALRLAGVLAGCVVGVVGVVVGVAAAASAWLPNPVWSVVAVVGAAEVAFAVWCNHRYAREHGMRLAAAMLHA